MLSKDDFYIVGSKVNFVSIDMIIEYDEKYLVGKRINSPAKGYYFVPGGVILKNEKIEEAFKRISFKELSIQMEQKDFIFCSISQHWYNDNFRDDKYGTHYVSLSYVKMIDYEEYKKININDQHSDIKWLSRDEILNSELVHPYTKGFFDPKYFNVDINDFPNSII